MLKWSSLKPYKHHGNVYFYAQSVKDYYQILGIKGTSTTNEIKEAYYKLSKQYHPDLNPGDSNAATKFREISEAYEILNNIFTKSAYDASRGIKQRSSFEKKASPTNIKIKEDEYIQFYKRQSHSARAQQFYQSSRTTFEQRNTSGSGSKTKPIKEIIKQEVLTNEEKSAKENSFYSALIFVICVSVFLTGFSHSNNVNNDLKRNTN